MKVGYSSVNGLLLMLYLFVSVNDILLLPFEMLWLKSAFLFLLLLLFGMLIGPRSKINNYLAYIFIVSLLMLVSFIVALIYGNNLAYVIPENFGVLVTLIVPIIVLNWINVSPGKIVMLSIVFLWSILFATLHKILFVFYLHDYLSIGFLQFLYKDLSGRGVVGEIERLNTGNQLLVSLALFMACRFFFIGYKKYFMCLVMSFCVINIYLTASRFFTPLTFGLLGVYIFVGVKGKWVQKTIFTVLMILLAYTLVIDLSDGRAASNVVDVGNLYRISQANFLFESFLSAPFFGNGPGYSIQDADYVLPWAFENQFLVLFAKYGLFGVFLIVSLVVYQCVMFKIQLSFFHYFTFIAFIVLASFFNPYLFGTYAAWAFTISLVLGCIFNENNREKILLSCVLKSARNR